jgi:Holliday junction resolvase
MNKTTGIVYGLSLIALIFLIIGCTPKVVTETTLQTANNIDQLEIEMAKYRAFLKKSANERITIIEDQHANLVNFNKNPKARPEELWKVAKRKEALELLQGVLSMAQKTYEMQLSDPASESKAAIKDAQLKFNQQRKLMKSSSEQLVSLTKRTDSQELQDLIDFVRAVAAEINKAEEGAENPEGATGVSEPEPSESNTAEDETGNVPQS